LDSLYAQYLKEKTNDQILETEKGFATYRYLDGDKSVYIVDIYVLPEFRKSHAASNLADQIVVEAKQRGAKELLGSVVPSTKGSTQSLKVLLGYGMSLKSSAQDFIVFTKGI
jgi:ribosomal protein S18 acetylase RimI-like enzyme